jgi:hypothetical protein
MGQVNGGSDPSGRLGISFRTYALATACILIDWFVFNWVGKCVAVRVAFEWLKGSRRGVWYITFLSDPDIRSTPVT